MQASDAKRRGRKDALQILEKNVTDAILDNHLLADDSVKFHLSSCMLLRHQRWVPSPT